MDHLAFASQRLNAISHAAYSLPHLGPRLPRASKNKQHVARCQQVIIMGEDVVPIEVWGVGEWGVGEWGVG